MYYNIRVYRLEYNNVTLTDNSIQDIIIVTWNRIDYYEVYMNKMITIMIG